VIGLCVCALSLSLLATAGTLPLNIGVPVDSLKPAELHDSFNEMHNGHRHEAIDIMRPRGTSVLTVTDGVIRKLFVSVQGGLTIYEFDRTETYCYYYAHLDHYAAGLHEEMPVARGDVIGYVGTTGNAEPDAPQLHFAIYRLGPDKSWWKGEPIDPYPILIRVVNSRNTGAALHFFPSRQHVVELRNFYLDQAGATAGSPPFRMPERWHVQC